MSLKKYKASLRLLAVLLVYSVLLVCYLRDLISSFLFVGFLLILSIILITILFIYRKNAWKRNTYFLMVMCILILLIYELPLTSFEAYTFSATGYREPEEPIDGSGIYIMTVGLHDVFYLKNETVVREIYDRDEIEIYELTKITNLDRYKGKWYWILNLTGLYKNEFHHMKENVHQYVGIDVEVVNEFLKRDNLEGNSAGLALGLFAMLDRKELNNHIEIGVTGTLERDGSVRAVGGIREKLLIAEENSFPYLIVPEENKVFAEEVKEEFSLNVKILPVNHIDEAVEVINQLNEKK